MNKIASLAVFVVGVVLIGYGLSASDSVGSGLSRFFTGSPTDKTIWLLLGGMVAAIVGSGGMMRGSRG